MRLRRSLQHALLAMLALVQLGRVFQWPPDRKRLPRRVVQLIYNRARRRWNGIRRGCIVTLLLLI